MTQHITLWQRPKVLPAGRKGAICIDLQPSGPGLVMLSARDDGVGLPEDFDLQATRTLA
jgi:two-component sensor histidine kinase